MTSKFIKSLSPGHVMPLFKTLWWLPIAFRKKIQSSYPGLHDPIRSLFLFLEQIHLATTAEPLHWLFALPRPLSQPPDLPRARCFSSFSSQLNYHLLTQVFPYHSVYFSTSPSIYTTQFCISFFRTFAILWTCTIGSCDHLYIISLSPEYKPHEGRDLILFTNVSTESST